jgi:5-(carboxyamino)imidazole ribonucleotide mutase
MPSGVPVATVALDGGYNAGILAAQIAATSDKNLAARLVVFKEELKNKVLNSIDTVEKRF